MSHLNFDRLSCFVEIENMLRSTLGEFGDTDTPGGVYQGDRLMVVNRGEDPDPHGSAFFRPLGSGSAILCGSGSRIPI